MAEHGDHIATNECWSCEYSFPLGHLPLVAYEQATRSPETRGMPLRLRPRIAQLRRIQQRLAEVPYRRGHCSVSFKVLDIKCHGRNISSDFADRPSFFD